MKYKLFFILLGLLCSVLGGYLCYDFIYAPILQASQGVPEVEYYLKAILISPLCFILGLYILITALIKNEQELSMIKERNEAFFRKPDKTNEEKIRVALVYLVVFAIPIITYWWFAYQMKTHGFEVEF